MFCQQLTLAAKASDHVRMTPLRCRSWTCEHCFPQRLRDLKSLAAAGNPSKFITLTANPRYYPEPYEALERLISSWRTILQRLKREGKVQRIEYVAIVELTKKGTPHLHILARAPFIDQQWLSDRMVEYMRSPIVWITDVKSTRQVSQYVAKYVAKGPARVGKHKRFFRSRNYAHREDYAPPKADGRYTWEVLDLHISEAVILFTNCDWRHRWDNDTTLILSPGEVATWPNSARPPPWQKQRRH